MAGGKGGERVTTKGIEVSKECWFYSPKSGKCRYWKFYLASNGGCPGCRFHGCHPDVSKVESDKVRRWTQDMIKRGRERKEREKERRRNGT